MVVRSYPNVFRQCKSRVGEEEVMCIFILAYSCIATTTISPPKLAELKYGYALYFLLMAFHLPVLHLEQPEAVNQR